MQSEWRGTMPGMIIRIPILPLMLGRNRVAVLLRHDRCHISDDDVAKLL